MAAGQLTGRLQKAVIVGDSHVYWLNRFLESAGPSWVWPGVSADFAVDVTVSKWNTLVVEGPPFDHCEQRSTGNPSHCCVPSSFFCTPG